MTSSSDPVETVQEILKGAQMRIECAKVCAPGQMADLVEGSQRALLRLRGIKTASELHRLLPMATADYASLLAQWQQRSGTIRVVIRVRPAVSAVAGEVESAVHVLPGSSRSRGLTISIQKPSRAPDIHTFKRFDYILDSDRTQDDVFRELHAMLPNAFCLTGPPQSACILAYGQTGSGKTYTMHWNKGRDQGLVPRVLLDVFQLAREVGAEITLSAVEIYNDIAYDLLDGTRDAPPAESGNNRGFQAGRLPPPPGLNFRHGCASALSQATSVVAKTIEEAQTVLAQAADRRSTRSTVFNATSSRSHSIVLVQAHLPESNQSEPALRLAFVDLAGSERLPVLEAGSPVAEESKHINLSLTSLGSVIHALRHRANYLPYRACLMTRLLEPFFGTSGRVLLFVCVSPEERYAQESLCSLNFADRASRAVLGSESVSEVQRSQALSTVREDYAILRSMIRQLLPSANIANRPTERLPDWLAAEILSYMPEHGGASFVCRAWSKLCASHMWWGRELRKSQKLAQNVLQWLSPAFDAAGVCRLWWQVIHAYHVTIESSSLKVMESSICSGKQIWGVASASLRADMWKAVLAAGGGSGAIGSEPLGSVRECIVSGAPKPEALKQVLLRFPELRVAEVPEPALVSTACSGLTKCSKLRALRCSLDLIPNIINMKQVLLSCRQLKVLVLTGCSEHLVSLQYLTEELPKKCNLHELTVARCSAGWKDIEAIAKCCSRLQALRLPRSFVEAGDNPLSPPPLVPLGRLKHLRSIDFRAVAAGRGYKHRPWLTDDMFGVLSQLKDLREVRADEQKLISERCFWFLRRHAIRLRVLHMNGCRPMSGDAAFGLLHACENLLSLRLPSLILGQSERTLATGTTRWCQGLHCPHLRELLVESWASLEDSGVRFIALQCARLRSVCIRRASQLSDDAVIYLLSLPELRNLLLAYSAGLTDRTLLEVSSCSRLRCLDLSGCRQLTEAAVVHFAAQIRPDCLRLTSLHLNMCPNLGRGSAEVLAACEGLHRCGLSGCRPMPEAAASWEDAKGQADACTALGLQAPSANTMPNEDNGLGSLQTEFGTCQRLEPEEIAQCAVCMDDITSSEPFWQCPVCCNKLHDTEDCARGWLRLKQSCPTCRAAAWAPPDNSSGSSPFCPLLVPLQSRNRTNRSLSADIHLNTRIAPSGLTPTEARRPSPSLPDITISGLQVQPHRSNVASLPTSLSTPTISTSAALFAPSRRPPRPAVTSSPEARSLVAFSAVAVPAIRARSLPPKRPSQSDSLSLAGLSIIGNARGSVA